MTRDKRVAWEHFRFEFKDKFRFEMMQLFNPWNKSYLTESYLFRLFTRIYSRRERLIKLFHFRVLITLILRDLRSIGVNQTIKVVLLLTVPVFTYRVNSYLNEKKYMMFIAPNFTKNLLMVPYLFVYLSKYDKNLLNNKNDIISENQATRSWKTSSESEDYTISWNIFEIFSKTLGIDESSMRTVATNKSLQSFNLLKRPQNAHRFQHLMKFETKRKIDFCKTKTYLFQNPASNCASSLDPGWNIFSQNRTDINHLNCIRLMNSSSPWNIPSSVCDQNKEHWKKIVLEITDQFSLSMTKSYQVDEDKIALDMDYHQINKFYELNESRLLNRIFNRREKLKNQILLILLDNIYKDNVFVDKIYKKDRAEFLVQIISYEYKMKVDRLFSKALFLLKKIALKGDNIVFIYEVMNLFRIIQNAFRFAFRFYLESGRNSKDTTLSNWIENESLNSAMQNAINRHSSTWSELQKKRVAGSIFRIHKDTNRKLNRNFIVYNWSIQTEYLRNGFIQILSSSNFPHNYVEFKNRVFDPNEYRVLVPLDIRQPIKEFLKLILFNNLVIDVFDKKLVVSMHLPNLFSNWWSKFRSKFNINYIVGHKSVIIDFLMGDEDQYDTPERMVLKEKRLVLFDSLFDGLIKLFKYLNKLLESPLNQLLKWIQSIVVKILDDSERFRFIDKGTISQSVLNEISMNQWITSLGDNQKTGMDCVHNTDLWARLNDQNWLNPLKLSNQSSLRTAFDKANTIEFFDYLHHPRLNYKNRLSPYIEKGHIKNNNLTYGQLFNLVPIHNNLFSLPIDGINPVFLNKEIISLIKSRVANILLTQYLRDRTLIHDCYKSFNLLTKLNHFVHNKRAISSIEEISTQSFKQEQQIVYFEKNSCPPFLNNLDSKENKKSRYKSDSSKDIDLIQNQSYADDLRFIIESLFMKMNNMELNKKVVKESTESSKKRIENKAIYYTSPLWKCIEDILLDTYMEIKKSTLLNKDKEILSKVLKFQINYLKWEEFYEVYRFCAFTSTWWKYLGDIYLYPFLEILINVRDLFASLLGLIQYKSEFIIHILDIFDILSALPLKLWAIFKLKLKQKTLKIFNYFSYYFSYYFLKFSIYVSYYVSIIYDYFSDYYDQFLSSYVSHYFSKIYNYFSRSKKWKNWYFSVSSWVESFQFKEFKEMEMMKRLEMMEGFMRDAKEGLINNEKACVLFIFSLAVGYFLLSLFRFPVHILSSTEDFFFLWKDRVDDKYHFEEFYEKIQTLNEPMPEIIAGWFVDYEDYRIPVEDLYYYFRRKWQYTQELKRETNFYRTLYTTTLETTYSRVDRRERQLAHFLVKEKSLSQLELQLVINPNDFSFKGTSPVTAEQNMSIAGYIHEQPGLLYLRYLAETYQKGMMNSINKLDQFGSAQRAVFLAFCNKITPSQKYHWDSLNSSRPNFFSLNLGPSSSYFSKRILLIGPRGTGRSFLAKSLATDSYIPLIRISLRYFLHKKIDLRYEFQEKEEDPLLDVPSIFDNTVENKLDRKEIDVRSLRRLLQFKRLQQFILALEMAKAMSPCVIWIPNIHELCFGSLFLSILVERVLKDKFPGIVIASTHIPKKVDPILLTPDIGLDKSIHIRLLGFSQRQREIAILLRSKGVYLKKDFACPDEFEFRSSGFDARDLAALTNEVFLMSISQGKSVMGTTTLRLATKRNSRGFLGYDVKENERLPYKVGKAFIQHILRRKDPVFAHQDLWSKRSFYLSQWYLEPSITRTSITELNIFCHILGCLAGPAAKDAWFISLCNKDKEDVFSGDAFLRNDFALASSLLESLLMEFSLGLRPEKTNVESTILTLAGQEIVTNHFDMMQKGISSFVNKKILKKEHFYGSKEDQKEEDFLNHIVWSPRTWRLSFLRSSQFDLMRRSNHFIELLEEYEDFHKFKVMQSKIVSPYGRCDKKYSTHKKWHREMEAILKERRIIVGKESLDVDYPMQYQSSTEPIFFLERFVWNPANFLFQEKRINLFSRREFWVTKEMLRSIYLTYVPRRNDAVQNRFRKRTVLGVFRESKILTMGDWNLEDILPKDQMMSFQRVQAFGLQWRHSFPYSPTYAYGRWLIEFSAMIDRSEFPVDRQREPHRSLLDSFIYNFLLESYQYLLNMFISKQMILRQIIKTLLKNHVLFSNEIAHLIAEEGNRNKTD
uniref:Ycf2 n=1 Tax=Podocarpus totara TaxID=56901 RepID=M1IF45_9CONI|nr:Ycf2 [Podocarpus totara]AGE65886.1 Ycf2 [Podocarpus totara]